MKAHEGQSNEETERRRQAEAKLQANLKTLQQPLSEAESLRLLHELQIHQIELETQNAELRQARDQVQRALEMYSDLYDFAPVGYMTLDREGLIRAANLTLATLLGTERSRVLGRRFDSFVAASDSSGFAQFVDRVIAGQTKESFEVVLLPGERPQQVVRVEAVANDAEDECRAAVIDISERRQLEKSLADLHADLLAHAAELEAANIDLEAFNYSVSHDLRGPLTVIAGYCEVIEDLFVQKHYEQCHGYLRIIQDGTMRMNQLIETLLDFSHVKCVDLRLEQVDLSKMVEEVALWLRATEPERRIRFRIAKGITAYGDMRLLRLVLDNLMGNAWKYSGKREEAAIEFNATEAAGKTTYFIRDNGSGFDMEHAEKLFKPFQRLFDTDIAGHGIGLATVDRIVRRHGGRVWAESKKDEGATFFFTLG